MEWPVNGQVVLDYNMDNTVYFPTLNVYKLNPAVAISAEVGSPVAAVANGKIVSVTENEETGTTVTVDMGNGYQAVYGQLKDVPFQAEEYVTAGAALGYINEILYERRRKSLLCTQQGRSTFGSNGIFAVNGRQPIGRLAVFWGRNHSQIPPGRV